MQTLELKGIVTKAVYTKLVASHRETELRRQEARRSGGGGGGGAELELSLPDGIELRLCPECFCRIEKNRGCDTMACYR